MIFRVIRSSKALKNTQFSFLGKVGLNTNAVHEEKHL
jgi:hypothetical protein